MRIILDFLNRLFGGKLARRGYYVYSSLGLLFALFIALDARYIHLISTSETKIYDFLVTHRLTHKKPASNIVIIDIDEGSLQALAPEFGRWPWPNQVFATLIDGLEKQAPKAIAFDIMFSDRDLQRPESEAAFNAAIARSKTTFFPMVRLDAKNDAKSQIQAAWLPGATALHDVNAKSTGTDSTIAVILPKIPAALETGRLGFLNVTPDRDGILRRYPSYLHHAGWSFDSYAVKIARETGSPAPDSSDFLLNWRGAPFSYTFLSFKDVYRALSTTNGNAINASPDLPNFKDKIILVGSTAPGLLDYKPTPLANLHPGVEILATAIDNTVQGDAVRTLPAYLSPLFGIVFIGLVAYGFMRNVPEEKINLGFTASQIGFIAAAFVALNAWNVYLDLSAAIAYGLLYFAVAKLYAVWRREHLSLLNTALHLPDVSYTAHALSISLDPLDRHGTDLAEQCLLRWTETSPPNSRIYWPSDSEKNSLNWLISGLFVVMMFSPEADSDAQIHDQQSLERLREIVRQRFSKAHYSLPKMAERTILVTPSDTFLADLRQALMKPLNTVEENDETPKI